MQVTRLLRKYKAYVKFTPVQVQCRHKEPTKTISDVHICMSNLIQLSSNN